MKTIYWQMKRDVMMKAKTKSKPFHMMSDAEFQRTVFDGEIEPRDANNKLAVSVAKISKQYDLKAIIAGLSNENAANAKQ